MKLFKCFDKPERTVKNPPHEVAEIPVSKKPALKIVLIDGHTEKVYGMRTYNDVEENYYNHLIIKRILKDYEGRHQLVHLSRKESENGKGGYTKYCKRIAKECADIEADLVIEFHLNAAGIPSARGYESLVYEKDEKAAYFAYIIGSNFSNLFNIAPRGNFKNYRGVKGITSKSRGGAFLYYQYKRKTPAIVWEPMFADYKSRDTEQFLEMEDYGVQKMADFWCNAFKLIP